MRRKAKGALIAAALVAALVCIAHFTGCLNVGMPRRTCLATVSKTNTAVSFTAPIGTLHQIVFDMPTSGTAPSGQLVITGEGKTLMDITIRPKSVQDCNWLHAESKGKSCVLTWDLSEEQRHLDHLFNPGQEYHVELTLDAAPSEGSSLWLTWVEAVNVFAQSLEPKSQEKIDEIVRPRPAIGTSPPQPEAEDSSCTNGCQEKKTGWQQVWRSEQSSISDKYEAARVLVSSNMTRRAVTNVLGQFSAAVRYHGLAIKGEKAEAFSRQGVRYKFSDGQIDILFIPDGEQFDDWKFDQIRLHTNREERATDPDSSK